MNEYTLTPPPSDPNEEELQVGPAEAESAAEVLARLNQRENSDAYNDGEDELPDQAERPTFTILQMMIVVTVLSVWLGVLRWLSGLNMPILSGLTGVAALVGMFWLSTQEDQPKIVRVMWWGMLLVYLTCSAATWMAG